MVTKDECHWYVDHIDDSCLRQARDQLYLLYLKEPKEKRAYSAATEEAQ